MTRSERIAKLIAREGVKPACSECWYLNYNLRRPRSGGGAFRFTQKQVCSECFKARRSA